MSDIVTDKVRKEYLAAFNVADIFRRVNRRTRVSVDIMGFNQSVDVQPIYALGHYAAVEMVCGHPLVTINIRGPYKSLDGIMVEFICPRCKEHHETKAFFGDKSVTAFSSGLMYQEATIVLSAMEERCETCVAFIKDMEANIAHNHAQIHAMEGQIRELQDEIHDTQLAITLQECRTKDCETCDRRRSAEETARMEALERDYNYPEDDEEEESDY
jgi:hypothetical protein